jgi:phosphatidylinositol-3-phosphatase
MVGGRGLKVLAVAVTAVLGACGPPAASRPQPTSTPAGYVDPIPSTLPAATPTAAATPSHVFVIVLENRSYAQATASSYVAGLASRYGVATNYHGVSHPSLPNYLAMTSGSTWGIADDGFHRLPATGLGAQLSAAHVSWRAYMEGMTRGCLTSTYPYALKHDPFAYYGAACPPEVVPLTRFAADLAGDTPRLAWITPGLCNDGHDCSSAVADRWLSQIVPAILASAAWRQDGLLVITWDEGEDASNSVLTLVIHPGPRVQRSARAYDHYSLLATIEDRLGVPRLGAAVGARPMIDLAG